MTLSTSPLMAYQPLDIEFTHGSGVWLYDKHDRAWLDSFSGIAVCGLGHAHPEIAEVIAKQATKLLHTSNLVHINQQELLARRLLKVAAMDGVFFCNSGAEANEAAIKLTRLAANARSITAPEIIVMHDAFHGRTMATLSASGNKKIQAGFEPLYPGFIHVPYDDIAAIEEAVAKNPNVIAIMLEPILGEAGVIIPEKNYLKKIRSLCDQNKLLMVLDEVQTGNGRCGSWYCYQQHGIKADIVTTAKGLGNGVPIGACMTHGDTAQLFTVGSHASTFGGNPLCCAAALKVIEIIERDQLCQVAAERGKWLLDELTKRLGQHPRVATIRGHGLMLGIQSTTDCTDLVALGLKQGILLNVSAGNTLRLLPALNVSHDECEQLVQGIEDVFNLWEDNL